MINLKFFPKDKEAQTLKISKHADKVNESTILQLVLINSGSTMHWAKHLRYAYLLQDELDFYFEARSSFEAPNAPKQTVPPGKYDLANRQAALFKAKEVLSTLTASVNRLAARNKLPPVLDGADAMDDDEVAAYLFAYIKARVARDEIEKAG